MADTIKKLYVDVQSRYLGSLGFSALDRQFEGFIGKQKLAATQGKLLADMAERDSRRLALAWERAQDRAQAAADRSSRAALRWEEVKAAKGEQAAKRYELAWMEAYRRAGMASEAAARAQTLANASVGTAAAARGRAGLLSGTAAIAGGLNMAGNLALGAGVAGIGAGGYLLGQAAGWQTYTSQQLANSPMSPQEARAFQQLSFNVARRTGADPRQVLLALRYGAEMGLGPAVDRRFLTSALALGLPTGGSAAIAPSEMALATVARNFPQMAGRPNAVANMILAASQNAAGVNAADFVSAIPRTLTIAGHLGGTNQLAQSLAITAALTRSGLNLDEAQTQVTNLIQKIMVVSGPRQKYIQQLKQATGIDLTGDFGPVALQKKGILGVLSDLHAANLGPATLGHLFPNMRGYFGALGLTGNQYYSAQNIYGRIQQSPEQNPLGANMARYMGLTSTQTAKLEQQLKILAITVGTELLPPFNELLKDDIVPLVKGFADFSKHNKGLINDFILLSPKLIAAGLAFKGIAGGLRLIEGASKGIALIKSLTIGAELSATAAGLTASGSAAAGAAVGWSALGASLMKYGPYIALAYGIQQELQNPPNTSKDDLRNFLPKPPRDNSGYTSQGALISGAGPIGKPWTLGSGLGSTSGIPSGLSGRWFGSSFGGVTSNAPSGHQQWWANLLGSPSSAGKIGDTDFGAIGGRTGRPYELPGSTKATWTFVGYVSDPQNKGQDIAIWKDPMGHNVAFNHTDPRGIRTPSGGWRALRPGQTGVGGNVAGYSLESHVCIVTTPDGRQDIMALTVGQMAHLSSQGYSVQPLDGNVAHKIGNAYPLIGQKWGMIQRASKATGVPAYVIAAYMSGESGGDQGALSRAGAIGAMQLMPGTAAGLGVNPYDTYQNILGGAKLIAQGKGKYGGNWNAIYRNLYNPGVAKNDPGYRRILANLKAWGGTGGGQGGRGGSGKQVNFAGSGPGTAPTTPAGWAQFYASQASNISSNLSFYGQQFAVEHGQNWGPHNLTPGEWKFTVNLLDALYGFQYQEALSRAHADFPHNAARRQAAESLARSTFHAELSHPFKYGPFAASASGFSANRVSPVQVVGSNRQLANSEAQVRHLKSIDDTLKNQLRHVMAENVQLRRELGKKHRGVSGDIGEAGNEIGVVLAGHS